MPGGLLNFAIFALAILAIVFLVMAGMDRPRLVHWLAGAIVCAVLLVLIFIFARSNPAAAVVAIPAAVAFLTRAAYQLG